MVLAKPFFNFSSFLFFFTLSSFLPGVLSVCDPTFCGNLNIPVRFPFWITRDRALTDSDGCGFPGFNLSCEEHRHTNQSKYDLSMEISPLPSGGNKFQIKDIDYRNQKIWVDDPEDCLARRVMENDIDLKGTQFRSEFGDLFLFFNCSYAFSDKFSVPCLSGDKFTVTFLPQRLNGTRFAPSCPIIQMSEIPGLWWSHQGFFMEWDKPNCKDCEQNAGRCVPNKTGDIYVTSCHHSDRKLSKKDKYGLMAGIIIPVFVFVAGVIWSLFRRRNSPNPQHRHGPATVETVAPSPQLTVLAAGLETEIIETYPKILVSQSKQLLDLDGKACPICLSEYKSKETLRTIPDCGHYFHMECIDVWLKFKGSCPLCRNSLGNSLEEEWVPNEAGRSASPSPDGPVEPSVSRVVSH